MTEIRGLGREPQRRRRRRSRTKCVSGGPGGEAPGKFLRFLNSLNRKLPYKNALMNLQISLVFSRSHPPFLMSTFLILRIGKRITKFSISQKPACQPGGSLGGSTHLPLVSNETDYFWEINCHFFENTLCR